jgi:glutamine---fructose-6-phosphate transaminase (isomerizing)
MCGIFGLIQKNISADTGKMFRDLFILSESRGKEASGFAIKCPKNIKVYKTPLPANDLVKRNIFREEVLNLNKRSSNRFVGIGHSRLVTNGYEQFDINNQPVVKNGMVVIHNGIIVNQNVLWKQYSNEKRISELDSELIPTIISSELENGNEIGEAIGKMFNQIYGMTNIALLSERHNNLILATNNGTIYYYNDLKKGIFVFASERYILDQFLRKHKFKYTDFYIQQLKAGEIACINLNLLSFHLGGIGERLTNMEEDIEKSEIVSLKEKIPPRKIYTNTSLDHEISEVSSMFIEEHLKRKDAIDNLKRCTKCILPESFPNIEFDKKGVCNYCNNYRKIDLLGKESLLKVANNYRRKDGKPECLIPFSGGRDSSYVLHYMVKELGLKPIAFSYDWGMLTDLGRRNQARMCGKLGVEHILVSANIRNKRENIRKNVSAWLKKPDLGTIPLFMAGDKQYFYHSKLLQKQNGLDLVVMGENHLEKTLFKSAFSGAKQDLKGSMAYHISNFNKIHMISYYIKQFIINPSYLNSSMIDTIGSFFSYYGIKHDYTNFFNFIKWDEKIITDILVKEYDWETDPGTKSTWRIGDGTAAFYNYIYYMVAGFTEYDTFRCNQIREGDINRKEALEFSKIENQPRWDSIQWYCNTIGIDFNHTIKVINNIKKKYK